ncbi:S41 family peptidase [Winogradskyella sp.]|uniref:S41 family peptidase n=1 Tax=Winogradskyella sp. TaxID=1883156 RepID=UPI003BAD39BC
MNRLKYLFQTSQKIIWLSLFLITLSCETSEDRQTKQIVDFAKTYGYAKYFYPSDEAASLDWDLFGVYACKQLLEKKEELEVSDLFQWTPFISFSKKQIEYPYIDSLNSKNAIYWQHIGNGEGKIGPNYKSARINRNALVLPNSSNDFSAVWRNLDVSQIQSKEVVAQAKIKIGPRYLGAAFLRLRIKQKDQQWKEITSKTFEGTRGQWVTVKVKTKIPTNIERAVLYVYSVGQTGHMSIDDIRLTTVEDDKISQTIIEENFSNVKLKEHWKTFGPNQKFEITNDNQSSNGFLSISRNMGNQELIDPLYSPVLPNPKIITKKLSQNTSVTFPLVLSSKEAMKSNKAWINLTDELKSITSSELLLDNANVRLANIIKVWNVFQHFYPYFDIVDVDWDKELSIAIKRNNTDKNKRDHILTLKRMVTKLRDSHIGVYTNEPDYYPPFSFEWIEKQMVITAVSDTIKSVHPGQVIKSINGKDASDFWTYIMQQSSGANDERQYYKGTYEALQGKKDDTISIILKEDSSVFSFTKTLSEDDFEKLKEKTTSESYFEIKKGIKYIDLTRTSWDFIKNNLNEISKSNGLIFDLRGYPQWKTMEIVRHFTKDTLLPISSISAQISYPNQEKVKYVKTESYQLAPLEPYIPSKKIFITDASAISYAETFLNIVSHYNLAQIVGSRTAGSTGNTNSIFLYGNISIPWTGVKVLDQDGERFHGVGVVPDHTVNKTINGIKKQKDEVLEFALKILSE